MKQQQENLLKKFDHLMFSKIDLFVQSAIYQKYTDFLKSFSQETKIIINKSIIAASVVVPLSVLLFFFISNYRYGNMVEMKKEMAMLATKIIKYKSSVGRNSENIIGSTALSSKNDFDKIIRNISGKINLNIENLKTSDFNTTPKDSFTETVATLNFKRLTTENLMGLINELTNSNQFKVSGVAINRDENQKLLDGSLNLLYYSINNSDIAQ